MASLNPSSLFGPLLDHVAEIVEKRISDQIQSSKIWAGLSEAIANSVEHAYQEERGDGFQHAPIGGWWMFTQIRDGVFTGAVCDLGIGYRRTMPKTLPEILIRFASLFPHMNPDALAIQAAMEYGATRTRQSNRGKGSRDALGVLTAHGSGELLIVSGTAGVRYTVTLGAPTPVITVLPIEMNTQSTMVWWKLPIGGANGDH